MAKLTVKASKQATEDYQAIKDFESTGIFQGMRECIVGFLRKVMGCSWNGLLRTKSILLILPRLLILRNSMMLELKMGQHSLNTNDRDDHSLLT